MSSSPTQLSPTRSPPLSSAFPRSPRDTPATPPTSSTCSPHAPPTPPDSSSRIPSTSNATASPHSADNFNTSSDFSLSTTLSASGPQFQSRLIDTLIDIHCLPPELDSPTTTQDPPVDMDPHVDAFNFQVREQGSPTPTQEAMARQLSPDALPPAFIPASTRLKPAPEGAENGSTDPSNPDSRPPNVYINGLPPNFPEEDLLAMTRPFGPVLSVRTFTRHVSDKPSGYGFVLFEALASAEKCIESLRKYRNLHPSFSKQVHKIPGTTYASVPSSLSANTGPADSFKAKMEQLGDRSSTNLYMEGLPLSITEQTLHALVTPYRIMSSRFFHTRLSSPPRIIAFVRLETREEAEDIVERLHGRLVRGWNDAGCRISVRFADTADQRELRRNERQNHDGEQSPARLTMARAALLNLKGTQYQGSEVSPTLSDINLGTLPNASTPNLGLAFNQLGIGQVSPISAISPLPNQDPFVHGSIGRQEINALGVNVSSLDGLNARTPRVPAQGLRLPQQSLSGDSAGVLDEQTELQLALMNMQGLRGRVQNGYTPVEQLILQAHVRQQQAHAMATQHGSAQGRTTHARPGLSTPSRGGGSANNGQEASRRLLDFLPQMSENDFHAAAALLQNQQALSQANSPDLEPGPFSRVMGDLAETARALDLERQISLSGQHTRQRNHTLAAQVRPDLDSQGVHTRSSTLPSQYLNVHNTAHPSNINVPLYDSSISLAGSVTNSNALRTNGLVCTNDIHLSNAKHAAYAPQNSLTTTRSTSSSSANVLADTQMLFTSKNNVNVPSAASRKSMNNNADPQAPLPLSASVARLSNGVAPAISSVGRPGGVPTPATSTSHDADDEDDESPVVSPALTYSTRTPASLSPATPYSGFFSENGEAFKNTGIHIGGPMGPIGDIQGDLGEVKQKVSGQVVSQ
ncbi:hypothetical protein LXA43DRAFT_6127 [Ganoderma leucocontextum]|nr:hypothetical protein LXA43DRAFT_6127 [Ganoderma leucocontextum]